MATERVVSSTADQASPLDEQVNWSLRPTSIDQYVGQRELIERLTIAIAAARARAEPMEHLLLHGPPGLGKTTLAHVAAAEMGTKVYTTSGPALSRGTDLVSALTRLEQGDILFIDEVHRVPIAVEEFVYPAMEDFRIDVPVDSGLHARTVQITLKPFTLIGATTRAGLVSAPLRSRFGITHHLRFYDVPELLAILARSAMLLGVQPQGIEPLELIARRSRGTPRIANRLLRRVRDFAQVHAGLVPGTSTARRALPPAQTPRLTLHLVERALALEGVDAMGLDELDRTYLRIIGTTYAGGPVGLEAVAATMNEDAGTLESVVEPYLLQLGFVARHRRGRMLTRAGALHAGVPVPADLAPGGTGELFDET
jgi:Holliday junction DNA helicase RuvB